jgi:adenine-specific DNA methylase
MSDEKKTHRYVKTCWRRHGEKYTWDFDITSQADWDEVLEAAELDNEHVKEDLDKLPKKVPSDLSVWEDAIGLIQNAHMGTDEEDEMGDYTWEEDSETVELKE